MGWSRWLLAALAWLPLGSAWAAMPLASHSQVCHWISHRLASVSLEDCLHADLRIADSGSVRGVPILVGDYPVEQPTEVEPYRVLLIGGVHGDELSSVSVVFRWIHRLRADRFRRIHWRIVPLLNPDGLLRRPATRTNANGVDLNRNFPIASDQQSPVDYWIQRTGRDVRRYPGYHPLSEPETRWLISQVEQFQPDAVVQVHAPYGVLDYDGPPEPPARMGYLHLKLLGVYPGSMGNYLGVINGKPVVTLELPHAGIMPTAQQQLRIWSDLTAWLARKLPARRSPPLFMQLAGETSPWSRTVPLFGGVATLQALNSE